MAIPYFQISGLEGLYLEDSFVLGIDEKPEELTFEIEFVLRPEHPNYRSPQPSEQYCYRKGRLRFRGVKQIEWQRRTLRPVRDANGEVDYGNFQRSWRNVCPVWRLGRSYNPVWSA